MDGEIEKKMSYAAMPRCITNVKHLPVAWTRYIKAWFNSQLFTTWKTAFNNKTKKHIFSWPLEICRFHCQHTI